MGVDTNRKSFKKFTSVKTVIAIVLVIAAVAGGRWYMNSRRDEIQYKTENVARLSLRSVIQATGKLDAVETVDVGTQISGTVKDIYIDYNSAVKRGDLIAEIDSGTQEADVAQARANLLASQAELLSSEAMFGNARKNLERARKLAARDLISKAELDAEEKSMKTAEAQVAASKARVGQSRAVLAKSNINLAYTKIYSPVDGVVIAKNVDKGQTVAASYQTPSIAEIAKNLKQMQVKVNVDEADIGGVSEGQKAIFTVDAHPNETFEGKVTQVRLSPVITDNVVTYVVIVKVPNVNSLLMPGMTANVSLVMQERKNVLVVPNSAFRFKPADANAAGNQGFGRQIQQPDSMEKERKSPGVYMLDNKKPVGVDVKRGITDGQNTEILSGLKEGDRVITGIVVEKEAN